MYHNKIVTCPRGFECIKQVPADVVENEIEAITLPPSGAPLFPECIECELGTPDDCSIQIMPDDDGVFHRVKLCVLKFRDPDGSVIE